MTEHPDDTPTEPPDAADPELPDRPLGVPAEADEEDEQQPGFQRDPPNAG